MDLSGVELAVLSACETGLGQSAGGEGLLGLQRSFHSAGARSTVASLWKVDDKATQVLMTEFYQNLWGKKLSKLESLRQAQLTMLEKYDSREQELLDRGLKRVSPVESSSETTVLAPYYWAAFMLSGDWQ
jgi:CHAT domain-containing protein